MSDLIVVRARLHLDLLYRTRKPLTSPQLVMVTNRTGTAMRTAAVEGLEDRIEVIFDENLRNQHAHHHDTTDGNRCRVCVEASLDHLGPL